MSNLVMVFGEMIAINAAFSFSCDAVAQLLEGKRFSTCCYDEDGKKVDAAAAPGAAAGVAVVPVASAEKTPVTGDSEEAAKEKVVDHTEAAEADPLMAKSDSAPAVSFVPVAPGVGSGATTVAGPHPVPMCDAVAPPAFMWGRAVKFASTGVIFCGVVQFVRLEVIENIFPANAGHNVMIAVEKTVFNQLIFSPVVRGLSMATIQYMDTQDCGDVKRKLKSDFLEAQGVSYAVKPVSNVLAFILFPHNVIGQTIIMRSVAFAYNVYFSYVAHRKVELTGGKAAAPDAKGEKQHGGKEPPTAAAGGEAGASAAGEADEADPTQRLLEEEGRKRKADARKCKMCRTCTQCSVM